MNRRSFIRGISFLSITNISCSKAVSNLTNITSKDFKFVLSSDLHFGQIDTNYSSFTSNFIIESRKYLNNNNVDFFIINGDLILNDPKYLPLVKNQLDQVGIDYYVNRGNHDMVSEVLWQQIWNKNLNYTLEHKGSIFIFLDTSNVNGDYLSPDLNWLEGTLNLYTKSSPIFLIIHIPQVKCTANAIDNPAFVKLISKYSNIKGIFHGHEHDQDGIYYINNIPCIFDSHVGGNWGTSYKGFRVVEVNEKGFNTYIHDYINNVDKNTKNFVF